MRHAQFLSILVVLVMVAGITSLGVAQATGEVGPTTITLDQPVHFLTPDGSPVPMKWRPHRNGSVFFLMNDGMPFYWRPYPLLMKRYGYNEFQAAGKLQKALTG